MCFRAGMGRLGTVAIDGTKIAANASLGANRSAGWLREQAQRIVAEAGEVDAAEDELFGERRGDELPDQWADPRGRTAKIRAALAELDVEEPAAAGDSVEAAAQEAEAQEQGLRDALTALEAEQHAEARAAGRAVHGGAPPKAKTAKMSRLEQRVARAQRRSARRRQAAELRRRQRAAEAEERRAARAAQPVNLTDPESRLMPTRHGWLQGYNAQLAVSADHLVLAVALSNNPADVIQYQPMVSAALDAVAVGAAACPDRDDLTISTVLADAGYLSDDNLGSAGPDRLIATGKRRDLERAATGPPTGDDPAPSAREAMSRRLATPEGIATYRRRGATVEPLNAHLKDRRGLRRFSRRGQTAAAAELSFAAAITNLLRLHTLQTA
jgi:hypothetical protein